MTGRHPLGPETGGSEIPMASLGIITPGARE
jgi:hypothetical protein